MHRRVASPAFAVALLVSLTAAGRAQSIRFGVGGGYTAAPSNADESSTGAWNAEAFLLLGLPVVPLDLRPTLFSYGRGTNTNLVVTNCPAIINTCPPTYASNGPERATGGAIDAIVRLGRGPFVPYLVGGPTAVVVSRHVELQSPTAHDTGLGYEVGAGARLAIGPLMIFGEAKYFGTSATADRFSGHSVHMIPVTVGFAL
jgi:hypothetical protein